MLTIVVATVTPPNGVFGDEQVSNLETIRAAVDFYASSVRTLSGKYRHTMWAGPEFKNPAGKVPMGKHISDCQFATDLVRGLVRRDCYESAVYDGKDGQPIAIESHSTNVFDGVRTYALHRTLAKAPVEIPAPNDHPIELRVTGIDEFSMLYFPWDAVALRKPRGGESFSVFLKNATARVDGVETLGDTQCVRIVAEHAAGKASNARGTRWTAWLDPTRGFLPRRMEISDLAPNDLPDGDADDLAERVTDRLDVLEYESFTDGAGSAAMWFARRAQFRSYLDWVYEIEVVDLKVNPVLDGREFVLDGQDLPDGVRIWDNSDGGKAKITFTGGREDLWKQRNDQRRECNRRIDAVIKTTKQFTAASAGKNERLASPVTATQPAPTSIGPLLLGIGSVLLIAIGTGSLLRKRRSN